MNNKLNQLYGRLDHFSTPFDLKLDEIRTDMDNRLDQLSSRIDTAVGHSSRYGMATPAQSPTVQSPVSHSRPCTCPTCSSWRNDLASQIESLTSQLTMLEARNSMLSGNRRE